LIAEQGADCQNSQIHSDLELVQIGFYLIMVIVKALRVKIYDAKSCTLEFIIKGNVVGCDVTVD
jgi:hypothetical protein